MKKHISYLENTKWMFENSGDMNTVLVEYTVFKPTRHCSNVASRFFAM